MPATRTSKKPQKSDLDRFAALVQVKLDDLEAKADAGEPPSLSELNGLRRLIAWVEQERYVKRQVAVGREAVS